MAGGALGRVSRSQSLRGKLGRASCLGEGCGGAVPARECSPGPAVALGAGGGGRSPKRGAPWGPGKAGGRLCQGTAPLLSNGL